MLIMMALARTVKNVIWMIKKLVEVVILTIEFADWFIKTGANLFVKALVGTLIVIGIIISISAFSMIIGLIII